MGVLFGLGAAVIALVVVLAYMAGRIADLTDAASVQHAKCIAHVADMTSNRIVGMAVRDLARRWDTVEEKVEFTRLRRDYKPEQSIGQRWLLEQAERIDPQAPPVLFIPDHYGEMKFDGSPVFTTNDKEH